MSKPRVIHIEPAAPRKPALGAPCNGCGLCCLAEPCPVGIWLSRRLKGRCAALRWDGDQARYRCGALDDAGSGWRRRLMARWIGAGRGCDADLAAEPASEA